ncbi:MAG: DEAD/DEAH box helicase [Promethearchaeota archaeon]
MEIKEPEVQFLELERAIKEIIWWNRSITKLRHYVSNPDDIYKFLFSYKGPFLELVVPPALDDKNWEEFCNINSIHEYIKCTTAKIIFNGDVNKFLYFHQARAIEHLCEKNIENAKHCIISVPTATGKTECFFIPILDYITKKKLKNEEGLKALIIYPMKTIEIDQLNRFLKYINNINLKFNNNKIKIGIWDGDTPVRVGGDLDDENYDIKIVEPETPIRGLKCPNHADEDLKYFSSKKVICSKGCQFNWIRVIRGGISNDIDILISNPESIEFLSVSPNKDILFKKKTLKYIVVDEIHIWRGISAKIFSLFLRRLSNFFKDNNLKFIFTSATIQNPKQFAAKLLDIPLDLIYSINYTPKISLNINNNTNNFEFDSIPLISFKEILSILYLIISKNINQISELIEECIEYKISERETIKKKLQFMEKLKILSIENNNIIIDQQFISFIKENPEHEINRDSFETVIEDFSKELFESQAFIEYWSEKLIDNIPELLRIISYFGNNSFMSKFDIVDRIKRDMRAPDQNNPSHVLSTLLNIGRIGNFMYDKYHYFIKPLSNLYFCKECKKVLDKKMCDSHPNIIPSEIYFCKKCHEPIILENNEYYLIKDPSRNVCSCKKKITRQSLHNAGVFYVTFASFLTTALTYNIPQKKVLFFSDGRDVAESIGSSVRKDHYALIAEKIRTYIVLCTKSISIKKLIKITRNILINIYINKTPFLKVFNYKSRTRSNIILKQLEELKKMHFKFLYSLSSPTSKRIYKSAILSFEIIKKYTNPIEKCFIHLILAKIITDSNKKLKIDENTYYPYIKKNTIKNYYKNLQLDLDMERREEIFQEIITHLNIFCGKNYKSEIFKKTFDKETIILDDDKALENIKLFVPEAVTLCTNCYSAFPAKINKCPVCGNSFNSNDIFKLFYEKRFSYDKIDQSLGFIPLKSLEDKLNLDYWAKKILGVALKALKSKFNPYEDLDASNNHFEHFLSLIKPISVGSHRSGLPVIVRTAFEEGFKRDPPSVNAIYSTPTLELGIDIGSLLTCVLVGVPPYKENYIQRTGRTGRKKLYSSLIITIIRQNNPIDCYFYKDILNRYLNRNLQEIRIPKESKQLLCQHVNAEFLRWLCMNKKDYNSYYILFNINDINRFKRLNLDTIFKHLYKKLGWYLKILNENYHEIIIHIIKAIYPNVNEEEYKNKEMKIKSIINELYVFWNEKHIFKRLYKILEKYNKIYNLIRNDNIKEDLIKKFNTISQLMNNLNLFSKFRNISKDIPIVFEDNRKLEWKDMFHALLEAFPGDWNNEENSPLLGGIFKFQTYKFGIKNGFAEPIALVDNNIKICGNVNCNMRFKTYPIETNICPFCNRSLEIIKIYNYYYAIATKRINNTREVTPIISHRMVD